MKALSKTKNNYIETLKTSVTTLSENPEFLKYVLGINNKPKCNCFNMLSMSYPNNHYKDECKLWVDIL